MDLNLKDYAIAPSDDLGVDLIVEVTAGDLSSREFLFWMRDALL